MEQAPIAVGGVWLRRIGNNMDLGEKVQVLVELPEGWVVVIEENASNNFSHIIEPHGMRHWKQNGGTLDIARKEMQYGNDGLDTRTS